MKRLKGILKRVFCLPPLLTVAPRAEISGGSISVTSAPGEGSEFTVRLPRMPETA